MLVWTAKGLPIGFDQDIRLLPGVRLLSVINADNTFLTKTFDEVGNEIERATNGHAFPIESILINPKTYPYFVPEEFYSLINGLGPNEAILSRTSAKLRKINVGGTLEFSDKTQLKVRAIVDDIVIGGAELAVIGSKWANSHISAPRYILLKFMGHRKNLEENIQGLLPQEKPARIRIKGEAPILRFADGVLPQVKIKEHFGEFSIRFTNEGRMVRNNKWVKENIVVEEVPIIGELKCHKKLMFALRGALQELVDKNLEYLIDPRVFGGCDNPRQISGGKLISRHAWGAAVDFDYGYGPTHLDHMTDPKLIEIMLRWGFISGHNWLIADPGHFEYFTNPNAKSS